MNTKNHESAPNQLLHGDTVYSIVGAAFNVMEELGPGFHEKPYENALVVELRHKQHSIDQQRRFQLAYKGVQVGEFIPDLIVDNIVIVDAKVIDRITSLERAQMLNYLRITQLRIGILLNFRRSKLEWERIIL